MLKIVGIVIFTFVLCWGIVAASFGLRVATAGIVGAGEARIQIQSAAFRLNAYNKFFEQCASIQGHEASIDALHAQLQVTTDPSVQDRLRTFLTGVTAARAAAIADYNADSRKDWTEAQFKDTDLPYQINSTTYVAGGSKTSCGT